MGDSALYMGPKDGYRRICLLPVYTVRKPNFLYQQHSDFVARDKTYMRRPWSFLFVAVA